MKTELVRPEYVEFIPRELESGVLYISRRFGTASHLCCCSCGTKIVTPLRKTEYTLVDWQGVVSLRPSIGNWNHPCQSHYWIIENQVIWASKMTREQIRHGREYDDTIKDAYFIHSSLSWWRRFGNWILVQLRSFFE